MTVALIVVLIVWAITSGAVALLVGGAVHLRDRRG